MKSASARSTKRLNKGDAGLEFPAALNVYDSNLALLKSLGPRRYTCQFLTGFNLGRIQLSSN